MGTYNYEKVVSDYANDRMTAEMATGHSLQHIGKLYEAQTAANVSRYKMRGKIDTLENTVNALQKEVARLTVLVEKFLPKRKRKSSGKQQESQPCTIRRGNYSKPAKCTDFAGFLFFMIG